MSFRKTQKQIDKEIGIQSEYYLEKIIITRIAVLNRFADKL
jgi:hypothetical protein